MIDQTAAYIDATSKQFKVEKFYDDDIIGPVDFGLSEAKKDPESFCFGSGILAGSIIPGAKRLIFFGHSPLWQNYYISTMGGAAFVFHKTGLNYVCIKGCCDKHSILKINFKDGQLLVDFEDVDVESIWRDYQGLKGTYALQKYCYDEYHEEFTDYKSFRILATGPAAQKTRIGAIMSAPIEKGGPNHVDCWAGRGGLGSKLVQEHKIVAVVYGGNFVNPDEFADDKGEIQELFMDEFNKSMVCTDIDVTKKYRFDPTYNSGGTFGVNYTKLKGWMFCFNYSSIYFSEEKRLDIHKRFVVDHYLKQFNEETIEKKQFKHCGEPCSVVCKKMNNGFKKDYEPYQTLGPNSGIFDQRAAEKLNHHADTMGFDAIQVGGLLSWILDILSKGLIKKEDFDISQDPKFDPDNFDIVADSMHNADLGVEILNRILF